ncbi:amidohydrolase family protein [bacterium]|nr:amidohydrolase family protein [candidate division CSSED10-310 bacterium]
MHARIVGLGKVGICLLAVMAFHCRQPAQAGNVAEQRIRCLYNGWILTVDPWLALADDDTQDRCRFYVLHAVLMDPTDGVIAAVYPRLPGAPGGGQAAQPVSAYPELTSTDTMPPPGVTIDAIVQYWREEGVAESLLADLSPLDLAGAVVTAGLADDHFHVTSWSKKLPAPGDTFGFWADVGDPAYYTDTETWERVCVRQALWAMVADANRHLADNGITSMYMHGFWYTQIDDAPAGSLTTETYLFEPGGDCTVNTYNDIYLLNRIGLGATAPVAPPPDPCNSDPSTWPAVDYEVVPVVLVHTSGQACWYNSKVLEEFNCHQRDDLGGSFTDIDVLTVTPPAPESGDSWEFTLDAAAPGYASLAALAPPFPVDIVTDVGNPGDMRYVPFLIIQVNQAAGIISGHPYFTELAEEAFEDPGTVVVTPFFRSLVECITEEDWAAAAAYWGEVSGDDAVGYGWWDPGNPHGTNWYNGAERGLIEYFHDPVAGLWRPSGYAEHYVMRDALSSFVIETPTVAECMEHRRRLAAWCHRHGLTAVNDIMFYRRASNLQEFESYEALSYDHAWAGGGEVEAPFNLRVGLYYYIENAGEVGDVLRLACNDSADNDMERLKPAPDHPEYPGWVRWLGWKIQLDGGTGARTICSSALMPKARITDEHLTQDEAGNQLTFYDHSFGLLTMSNLQEQVFTSRESAGLYWLVRESDPDSPFHNSALAEDWSFFREGVTTFLDRVIDEEVLRADLANLDHVELEVFGEPPVDQPAEMAAKLVNLVDQINDGYKRTLAAIAKIWFERSMAAADGVSMPAQTVSHCLGDGAVDLWVHGIKQIRDEVTSFPAAWEDLPEHWRTVVPEDADLSLVRTVFENERFRVEHILHFASNALADLMGTGGLNQGVPAASRNVVFSLQPALLGLDGQAFLTNGFPYAQELWEISNGGFASFWRGVPWRPRTHHAMPCPMFLDHDIPFTLDTDPPSVRDPRPAITIIAAAARTPVEIDPSDWVGNLTGEPVVRPPDYYVGKAYGPLGLTPESPTNPMRLSVEQSLCAMTFWGAYTARMEESSGSVAPGRFADLVIWNYNPLGIKGPTGLSLEQLGRVPAGSDDEVRVATINTFIDKFLPAMTLVGAVPVWQCGVRIDMPRYIRPGQTFHATGLVDNPSEPMADVPVCFVLDVFGEYWFWPGWIYHHPPDAVGFDYCAMDIATGTTAVEVIPAFSWPDTGNDSLSGIYLYGAMLNTEMNDLFGAMAIVEWGFGP